MSGSSFTNIFGGTTISPSNPSYLALALTANTQLYWPLETTESVPCVASLIDVTPSGNGLTVLMPPANTGSTGISTIITNVGAYTFTVADSTGTAIATVDTTESWIIALIDNETAEGEWRGYQLASTTSSAVAADLAGAGLQADGSRLRTYMAQVSLNTNTNIDGTYRAKSIVWTGGAGDAGGILAPFVNPGTILPVLAAGVVVLTWLAQLRHGVKAIPSLLPLVLTLATAGLALLNGLFALLNDERGTIWSQHSITLVAVFIPLVGAIAALMHWAPKLVGGAVAAPLATLSALAATGGAALYIASGALLGADGSADYAATFAKEDGHGGLAMLGAVGIALAAAGVVLLALAYAGARNKAGAADPYGTGTTLEWAAASPPPAHNFDSVPDVTSPTPLLVGGSAS